MRAHCPSDRLGSLAPIAPGRPCAVSRRSRRGGRTATARLLALFAFFALGAPPALASEPSLRIDYVDADSWVKDSDLVFYVDLLDAEYKVIPNLAGEEVNIYIGERPLPGKVTIEAFGDKKTEAVAVVILMAGHNAFTQDCAEDAPTTEEGQPIAPCTFQFEKEGVKAFLSQMGGADRVAIWMYTESGLKAVDTFSSQFEEAKQAVDRNAVATKEVGEKIAAPRLFAMLTEAIDRMAQEEDLPRRKIVVLMSDGLDQYSERPDRLDQGVKRVLEAAAAESVSIFAIGYSPGQQDFLRDLKRIALKTGGVYRLVEPGAAATVPDVFRHLADQIKKQYIITLNYEDIEGGQAYRFRMKVNNGGRIIEGQYDPEVKLGDKPFPWKRVILIGGIALGGALFLFLLIWLIVVLVRRSRDRAPAGPAPVEYAGPSLGGLEFTTGPLAGETFPFSKDVTSIGRHEGNDLIVPDASVSKRHAGIKIDEMRYEVADFGSANGTFVNDRRVDKCFLKDGDRVKFGNVETIFRMKA